MSTFGSEHEPQANYTGGSYPAQLPQDWIETSKRSPSFGYIHVIKHGSRAGQVSWTARQFVLDAMMFIIYSPLPKVADEECFIAVREADRISSLQVQFVLGRHKIRCFAGGMHGFGNMAIAAECSAQHAAKILAIEAPRRRFSMHITGFREFSDRTWPWSKAKSLSQLDRQYPSLKLAAKLSKLSASVNGDESLEFRVRKYTGPDFKHHMGIDIMLTGQNGNRNYQILQ